jgi:hypothetical protein
VNRSEEQIEAIGPLPLTVNLMLPPGRILPQR